MIKENIEITARDGYKLSATLRKPLTRHKGVIQFHCGTGIPQRVYSNLADFLTQNGYVTVTFDYRGIGESKPYSLKGFSASLEDWGKLDMTSVFDWVLKEYPADRKTIVAHSMGGQLIGLMENSNRIDQLFLIASSTGYWKDMSSPYKWVLPPVWFLFIPMTTFLYGFANARKIRQGENLPKGVALQWRKWCIDRNYFERDFLETKTALFFDDVKIPVKSFQIADDPIANKVTANKILTYDRNAEIKIETVSPVDLQVDKIGHTGFFSRKFKASLWQKLLNDIEQKTSA